MTISASDVGSRVMVRKTDTEGFTDVLGDLLAWSDDTLTIATRRGNVTVALDTIVAGKRIPPAMPRRRPRGQSSAQPAAAEPAADE